MKNLTRAEAAGFFLAHDNFTILTHRRPDGDTLGSAAALCLGLRKMGKHAWVLNPTESLDNLDWLLADITKDLADNKDTIVAVDVAAPNMLPRDFAELAEKCRLRIDHHGSCTPFAPEELVDADSASCAEIICDILTILGVEMDADIADALYVGVASDTGCFRFANKEGVDPKKVYSNAFVTVFCISATFLALMIAFASPIASLLGYEGYQSCIMYMGGILALDAVTAILFAKLRQENKALKFAVFKTIKIITETAANLFLFLWFPKHVDSARWLLHFISETPDFSYVIFAIFISCVVCGLLFIPEYLKLSFRLEPKLLRQMLIQMVFAQSSL